MGLDRTTRSVGVWMLVFILQASACQKRVDNEPTELETLLDGVDRTWLARGSSSIGLEGARSALDRLPAAYQTAPEVVWRRVRVSVASGLSVSTEIEARRWFAQGRAEAVQCVRSDDGGTLRELLNEPQQLAAARRPCALWAGVAWTRWLTTFGGDAAATDLDLIRQLIEAGDRADDADVHDIAAWTRAILLSQRPHAHGGNPVAAKQQLQEALKRSEVDPDRQAWVRWLDLHQWGGGRDLSNQPAIKPFSPEDRAAAQHGAALED